MITAEQANYLINLPKKIVENDRTLDNKTIMPSPPFQDRLYMLSEDDDEFNFFLEVNQSGKKAIKFTLHFQEDGADYGLLRVDYNGRHKNPEVANEFVPEKFLPYTGLWLDEYPGHIHYIVDGYAPLKWAIPLEIDDFQIKEINAFTDITDALLQFCKKIKLQTIINTTIQSTLFL